MVFSSLCVIFLQLLGSHITVMYITVIYLRVKQKEITVMLSEGVFKMAKAGRGSDQFPLRLPDGLRDRIKVAAERGGRSMNTEIVRALELAFPKPVSLKDRLELLPDLFSAVRKLQGYDGALDVIIDATVSAMEAGAAGRDPTLDDGDVRELQKAMLKLKGRHDVELAARKREVDEKYKSSGEAE
ncbi:Arc family DNA-binding protein [Rhizobium leguminosarum]|uniref:Arc family DNA-binding protein n=1 Tax=Rhizobium leguminosarum TaxID=384 RepID=UPI0028F41556|nr:Arc family DNA-binding protein [Rhizobium leguminosarum]